MDSTAAAARWRETWLRGWPAKDVEGIVALYAPGAPFRPHPFRDELDVRDYVEWAFSEQDDAECWFGEPRVDGDRAAVEYWAVVSFEGREETIAGISMLRFGADDLVAEQRDYWNGDEGRREPPERWGS